MTIATGGKESKVFVEAAPQFKSLNFYDEKMYRLKPEQLKELSSKEVNANLEAKQDMKKEQKQSVTAAEDEPEEVKSQKKSRKKSQKVA